MLVLLGNQFLVSLKVVFAPRLELQILEVGYDIYAIQMQFVMGDGWPHKVRLKDCLDS